MNVKENFVIWIDIILGTIGSHLYCHILQLKTYICEVSLRHGDQQFNAHPLLNSIPFSYIAVWGLSGSNGQGDNLKL